MAEYKPSLPYNVASFLLIPTYTQEMGVKVKHYLPPEELTEQVKENLLFFCSFRTFGGTERESNGLYIIEDTATIETWFRPDRQGDCGMQLEDGSRYEIIGTPENINMRNQFLKFKVRKITGGA